MLRVACCVLRGVWCVVRGAWCVCARCNACCVLLDAWCHYRILDLNVVRVGDEVVYPVQQLLLPAARRNIALRAQGTQG